MHLAQWCLALVKVPRGCYSMAATTDKDNSSTIAVCAQLESFGQEKPVSWHHTAGLKPRLEDLLTEQDWSEVYMELVHRWVWDCSLSGQGSLETDMSSSPEALIHIYRLQESFSSGQNFLAWQPLCWDQCWGCRQHCLVFHLPVCLHLLFPVLEFRRKLLGGGDLLFWWTLQLFIAVDL